MIDTTIIMAILVDWAKKRTPQPYKALSLSYQEKTGEWYEPHGSWDKPLGILNRELAALGAPALSALVIKKNKNEPGDKFWGCASNVPVRPKSSDDRIIVWAKILNTVFLYDWDTVSFT